MPVYTRGQRRGLPRPLRRYGPVDQGHVRYWFGRPCDESQFVKLRVPGVEREYPFHRRVAEAWDAAFQAIRKAGAEDLIDPRDFGGSYCCRAVRGGSVYSPHAWAIAADFNYHHLLMDGREVRSRKRINWHCQPSEIAPSLRELYFRFFLRWGFTWGGIWTVRHLDPMHFEATEITVALLEDRTVPGMELWHERLQQEQVKPVRPATIKLVTTAGELLSDEVRLIDGRAWVPVREAFEALGYEVLAHKLKSQGKIYLRRRK